MLKLRVITAVVLLAILLPVLYSQNFTLFVVVAAVFFGAAIWECMRLFSPGTAKSHVPAIVGAVLFALLFGGAVLTDRVRFDEIAALGVILWIVRFAPSLKFGLPPLGTPSNSLLSTAYALSIVSCFTSIVALYSHSPVFLLSVLALVWIADIGAYAAGKTFGKHKLAPSISPGKSWEGAIGGCVAVVLLASASVLFGGDAFANTFAVRAQAALGWPALVAILVVIVVASIVGDLFESQLKRRAGMKDSSNLLPGHGGVLDRIDALVPVLPLIVLIGSRLAGV